MSNSIRSRTHQNLVFGVLGVATTIYFELASFLKIIDVVLLAALIFLFPKFKKLKKRDALVVSAWMLAVASTFSNWIIFPNTLSFQSGKAIAASLAALVGFLLISGSTKNNIKFYTDGFLVGITVSTALSLLTLFSIVPITEIYSSRWGESIIGFMSDPSRYAFVTVVAIAILLGYVSATGVTVIRLFAIVILIVGIVYSGSRSGLIMTGVTFLVFLFETVKRNCGWTLKLSFPLLNILVIVIFLAIGGFALQYLEVGAYDSFSGLQIIEKMENKSLVDDPRFEKIAPGLAALQDKSPLFLGLGLNGYENFTDVGTSHNTYLEILVSGGVLALLLFSAYLALSFRSIWTRAQETMTTSEKSILASQKILIVVFAIYIFVINVNFLLAAYMVLGFIGNCSTLQSRGKALSASKVEPR